MARKFQELVDKMPPESRARIKEGVRRLEAEMHLEEVRAARELTQEDLAAILRVDQSAISKLERRTDMYVSTLNRFIKAMGGDLRISAVFPDGEVQITQFEKLEKR
jgi:DNA-binding XRE family transcriptional regulator